jgi:tryptophan synthase alpha subunit
VGVGISTPDQAAEAVTFADGAVVGSALMEPLVRGDRDEGLRRAEDFSRAIRQPA